MARKKRRGEVPEVLWRLFHKRARTLADTIIALIPSPPPPSPAECRCKGRRCLRCCRVGDEAISFLVRPSDPLDYRKLLNKCFVVVSDTAPPFSSYDHHCRWSQLEIVRRTIEIVISEQSSSSNLVCAGYDKRSRTSAVLDLLTSSAWKLLLTRVGDVLMVYLLMNTSMFLPLSRKQYHQVAGYPISDMCITLSKHVSSTLDRSSARHLDSGKKRKRVNQVNLESVKQLAFSSLESELSGSNTCVGCNSKAYLRQPNGHQRDAFPQTHPEKCNVADGDKGANKKICPLENSLDSSNQTVALPKKRVRQWSWQRHRKRRQLNLQGSSSLVPCTEGLLDKHHSTQELTDELQCESNPSSNRREKTSLWCSCCLVFQTLPKVTEEAGIDRRSLFYKLEDHSSLFPWNHILYTLKPNSSGANVLFREIFGYFESDITAQSLPCSHSTKCCCMKSVCL